MATVLSDLAPGSAAMIRKLPAGGVFLRLREMGLLPGTTVKLLRAAPSGDPLAGPPAPPAAPATPPSSSSGHTSGDPLAG